MFFVHTPKAVKAGHPADRLFIAVNEGPEFLAWKTTITGEGIVHPMYRTAQRVTEGSLASMAKLSSKNNGSEPTALFKRDSFYHEVTMSDILARVTAAKKAAATERKVKALVNVSTKTFETSPYDWMNFSGPVECLGKLPESKKAKVVQLLQKLEADLKAL